MEIKKNNKIYDITEHDTKWTVKSIDGKLTIFFDISKDICNSFEDVKAYILNNDKFFLKRR